MKLSRGKKTLRFPKVQTVLDGEMIMFEFQGFIGMSGAKDTLGGGGQSDEEMNLSAVERGEEKPLL